MRLYWLVPFALAMQTPGAVAAQQPSHQQMPGMHEPCSLERTRIEKLERLVKTYEDKINLLEHKIQRMRGQHGSKDNR
jgi:hypothetical protein